MANQYPKRGNHFAHKFVRLIGRLCLANEIGADAAYLLVIIAHTEDAKHYTGPVTFYNEQLCGIAGIKNVQALIRLRDKAVNSGFLHYEPGAKNKAAKYWVTIPDTVKNEPSGSTDCHDQSEIDSKYSTEIHTESVTQAETKRNQSVIEAERIRNPNDKLSTQHTNTPTQESFCTETEKPSTVPQGEPSLVAYQCDGIPNVWHLTQSQVDQWQEAYPSLEIIAECKKANAWLQADPSRRKTAKGMKRFLLGWLSRTQDRGKQKSFSGGWHNDRPEPQYEDLTEKRRKERAERERLRLSQANANQ